jgi:hypothetical protein
MAEYSKNKPNKGDKEKGLEVEVVKVVLPLGEELKKDELDRSETCL